MQPVPGQGPHNPAGHSRAELIEALHGATGSRLVTFRYELWDRTNTKVRDLPEVEDASVSQNWLADIKRTVDASIRDDGTIDWLSDRIVPFARVHLPPWGAEDWIELPLGVFLPSTPPRAVDAAGVIRRAITGYDKLQILADEATDGRLATSGIRAADDHYRRSLTGTWGDATSGQTWVAEASTGATLGVQISPQAWGFITTTSSASTLRELVLDAPEQADTEIYCALTFSPTPSTGSAWPGVLMRWTSVADFYRVRVLWGDDESIGLQATSGTTTVGDPVDCGFTRAGGLFVYLRARVVGHRVQARCWPPFETEPTEWQLDVDFEELGAVLITRGRVGVVASSSDDLGSFRFRRFAVSASPLGRYTDLVDALLPAGEPRRITPSGRVLPATREWDAGTTTLEIVNDLLGEINYESISVDEWGVYVAEPYVSPQERAGEYVYADDEASIMHPEAELEFDLFDRPNRWVRVVSNPDQPPIRVEYSNNDPASPTSIPRRGRVITDFDDEAEASDKAALLEQVVRAGFESTQIFEAVEFDTALNPLHSGNDVYRIVRDDLALNAVYAEHSWEMELAPGAAMRHRARRVVTLDTTFDDGILLGDLTVTGAVSADNMAWGIAVIDPVANTPTAAVVSGLELAGTGIVRAQATAESAVPHTAREESVYYPTRTGMTVYLYRTNDTQTNIHWFIMRDH